MLKSLTLQMFSWSHGPACTRSGSGCVPCGRCEGDYMARVDPSLRTWTRSIRIAHDSFLDLELHRGQLRAFQGGQLFELPYAAARVDPDCPVNNENHLERTIVERMLQMILPWSYCWKCSSGRSCGEVQKRQGAVVQDSAQKKAEPEVCEDDNKNMVWNHLPGCKSFASMGYCQRFAPLARKYCRLSCALCTVGGGASSVELVGEKDLQARARLRQSRWLALA
ncbi:unnamed protein product [Effrenium voratum]|nr:unnamed protein product [Effrenium voratum]